MVRPIWFKLTFVLLVLLPIGFWAGVECCKPGRVYNDSHLAHALSKVVNLNPIKLAVGEGIDLAKVRVDWGGDGPPGQSPHFHNLVFNGSSTQKPDYVYGWNYFKVSYDGLKIRTFAFFKTNNWHSYRYSFRVDSSANGPVASWQVLGPDSL